MERARQLVDVRLRSAKDLRQELRHPVIFQLEADKGFSRQQHEREGRDRHLDVFKQGDDGNKRQDGQREVLSESHNAPLRRALIESRSPAWRALSISLATKERLAIRNLRELQDAGFC